MRFKDRPSNGDGQSLPFLKLKDGEKILGVFKGDIHEFYQVWEGKKIVPAGTKGASFRFRINFITKEGASYVAKVMEQGATIYDMLKDLNESYPLEETVVEIKRSGATKDDTRYSILPLPPSKQPGEQAWKIINQTPLNILEHKMAQSGLEPEFGEPPPEAFDEHPEIPF
jgi:hypothetical protein